MPKLIIDTREIEVPAGTKVIEAAERLGILIPRFCYHPALGSVGACRMCAVAFQEGPVKGIQMSCMVEARDQMVVSSTDPGVVDFRRQIIEWLMINHPHDCPVCDAGGHCLLQDMTVSGGHGRRRYQGLKRTYRDQNLGPLVQHEMNRCIQCYRCARYYQEFAGYRDLGVLGIGQRVYFGRHRSGILESPFAGNLIDLCPTGVFTDKPSRFKGRRWDYARSPGICLSCSLGCHLMVSTRHREIVCQEARVSAEVNGHFICDRGRNGFYYTSAAARPRQARIDGQRANILHAVITARDRLAELTRQFGADAVAVVGSERSSLETLVALTDLARKGNGSPPIFWNDTKLQGRVIHAVSGLDRRNACSLKELELADLILVVGADPLQEAPMAALGLRQAQRAGARIYVLDPRPVTLPCEMTHLPMNVDDLASCLSWLILAAGGIAGTLPERMSDIAAISIALRHSHRPVLLCGTGLESTGLQELAAELVCRLHCDDRDARLFYLIPGSNSFGAALFAKESTSLEAAISKIETGRLRALIVAESDILGHFVDRVRLENALNRLELLIVLDYLDTPTSRAAHIFMPTTTIYESGGWLINQEGRLQHARPDFPGGEPIVQTGHNDHPPRTFLAEIPGGEPRAAWEILIALAGNDSAMTPQDMNWPDRLKEALPVLTAMDWTDLLSTEGGRIPLDPPMASALSVEPPEWSQPDPKIWELIVVDWTFGTETLSVRSSCLDAVTPAPCIQICAADAADLGLAAGDTVVLDLPRGALAVTVQPQTHMARQTLVLPRHHRLNWQQMGIGRIRLSREHIHKQIGET